MCTHNIYFLYRNKKNVIIFGRILHRRVNIMISWFFFFCVCVCVFFFFFLFFFFRNISITKTCLYNFDPLKPHFYIVKLGFTGGIHYFSKT